MPPGAVKTVEDVIFWQYAKIISDSARFGKTNYGFVMSKFMDLKNGRISWSSTIREWIKENEKPDRCIYCDTRGDLTVEHILPRCCGGPDIPDNAIRICRKCNSSKGGKRLYEWKGLRGRNDVPRIAEGKYLKLLYKMHEENGTLHVDKEELTSELCPRCDMGKLCEKEGSEGRLTVFCLEGSFKRKH
jgi:hypothetical protein